MIKIENVEITGWESAIRGMRNPLNSWERSDSGYRCKIDDGACNNQCEDYGHCNSVDDSNYRIGDNDLDLMRRLARAGSDHAKYRRFIVVTCDLIAPLYWWKEYDTYKVGTVANSCSTMHKIQAKEFTLDDFSHEHLGELEKCTLNDLISILNMNRHIFNITKSKESWWQMIQLLPSSYNQRRTVQLNYQVLANMYKSRRAHKLDEWRDFCKWVTTLPYSDIITGEE